MRILVVDGDQLFARLMRTKLEKWGHKVTVEYDGASAFERIRREPFRMVILDWDLPGINGPELCTKIRKLRELRQARYTYIIFYTAKSDKDSLMAGLEAGADDYLTKPLNTVELRLRMKNGKRLLNLEDVLREGPGADAATGVVNAASFRQFFRVIVAEATRTGARGALVFIRLSNYRQIYEEQGFAPAQDLLGEIARMLVRNLRDTDLVARLEDDLLCVLLQNTDSVTCQPLIDKLTLQLENLSVMIDGVELRPEGTIEGVDYPVEGMSFQQILDEAPRTPLTGSSR